MHVLTEKIIYFYDMEAKPSGHSYIILYCMSILTCTCMYIIHVNIVEFEKALATVHPACPSHKRSVQNSGLQMRQFNSKRA